MFESARVSAVGPGGGRETLSWTPGADARAGLERAEAKLEDEQATHLFQSEYLIGNYLLFGVSAAELESAAWDPGDSRLKVRVGVYQLEWSRQQEGLQLESLTRYDKRGRPSYRQEYAAHRVVDTIGCAIAHERRTLIPKEGDASGWDAATSATLEAIAFLAAVPAGFAELDTTSASVVDLARGVVYDDAGNEIGRVARPQASHWATRWTGMMGIVGVGLAVGGGVWWWLRRRATA